MATKKNDKKQTQEGCDNQIPSNLPSEMAEAANEEQTVISDKLVYIPTTKLSPHPDNPRKDLGDLTELADSIKENGVLQNLTVVRRCGEVTGTPLDCFTVIIGHRRLAAAKLAGLNELPCVIVEMTLQDQVRTMLMENIQRADLTVYEQAQGFQLMLNLGDSVDVIARKSGFSQTTVRRRVKLLELDEEKFKKSEARGATMFDYMELDKVKSVDRKNEVLAEVGTDNFKYKLKQAIDAEATEERRARWVVALSAFAAQVDSDNGYDTGYTQVKYYGTYGEPDVERPADADDVEYFFNVDKYGGARIFIKGVAPKNQEDPEEIKRREYADWRRNQLAESAKRTYELRNEFAEAVSATCVKKHLAEIVAYSLWEKYDDCSSIDEDDVLDLLGIELREAKEDDEDDEELTCDMVLAAVSKAPEKMLWKMVYAETCDSERKCYYQSWNAEHRENEGLTQLYALLVKMGYEMSDEEKALQDGTHTLFSSDCENDGGGFSE